MLQAACKAADDRAAAKAGLQEQRKMNLDPSRPSDTELAQLDSSVRKNGVLARKLRSLTDASVDGVLGDSKKVNQSKFLSEAVSALLEAARKPSKTACVLKVCSVAASHHT